MTGETAAISKHRFPCLSSELSDDLCQYLIDKELIRRVELIEGVEMVYPVHTQPEQLKQLYEVTDVYERLSALRSDRRQLMQDVNIEEEDLIDEGDQDIKDSALDAVIDKELKAHMHNLHQYNDYKDATQALLGRIAQVEGVTVKQLYQDRFDLSMED